jgi:hypothetical protein
MAKNIEGFDSSLLVVNADCRGRERMCLHRALRLASISASAIQVSMAISRPFQLHIGARDANGAA